MLLMNYENKNISKKTYDSIFNQIESDHKTKKNVYLQDFLKKFNIKIEENSKYYSTNIENIKNSENTYMNLGKFDN